MPFVEQEAGQTTETTIDGRKVPVIKPKVIVTLTHKETGREYMSNEEADADINDPNTTTTKDHIKRDVQIEVAHVPIGAETK